MKKFLIIVLVLGSVFAAASGFSEVIPSQRFIYLQGSEQLFSVDFTDMWNLQMEDGDIVGTSDDGKIWFFLGDVKGTSDIKDAKEQISDKMSKYFTDIEAVSALDEFSLNGLQAHAIEGTAKQKGKDVVFFLMVFKADADNMGVLVFVMDPSAQQLHLTPMHQMILSVSRR